MKICHVTSAHKTNDVRIFLKECTSLAKNPEDEVFLVGQGDDRIENDVTVIGAGILPTGRLKRMLLFSRRVVNRAKEVNAEVYHLHDPELIRHALKLKKKGAYVIFDSHENILDSIDEKLYMPRALRFLVKKYYSYLQRKVYPKIDAIIVVSPQMIEPHLKFNKNVVMISNFPIVAEEIEYRETKGNIVFAGGVSNQWSHKELLKAIRGIEEVHYYVYGIADKDYLKDLLEIDESHFTYGGVVSFKEVQSRLEEAEMSVALLKPGKNTFFDQGTLGNTKLFEAMMNKKPIIATDFVLWKRIIEDNKCGLCVDPNDSEEIRKAIIKVHSMSEEDRKQMGENGRKTVIEQYNWTIEEGKLINLYQTFRRN